MMKLAKQKDAKSEEMEKECDDLRCKDTFLEPWKKDTISSINNESGIFTSYGSNIECQKPNDADDKVNAERKLQFNSLNRRQKFVLVLCCVTNVLEGVSFSVIAPFFPTEALSKGMSLALTGFVFSGFQLVTFIISPIFGANIRHLGPKFVVISGTCVAGSCTILFGLLDKCPPEAPFITLAFVCRTLEGIGFTAYFIGLMTFLTTEFPNDISTIYSLMHSSNGIGMMVGPALGAALYELGGYELPFYIIGSIVLFNMVLFWVFIPDITPAPKPERHSSQFSMLRSLILDVALFAMFIASLARNFLNPILSPYLKTFGLNEGIIGLYFIVPMLFHTSFCPLWGYLTDKRHLTFYLIVVGYFFYGIGYLIIGPSNVLPFLTSSYWNILLGLTLSGICFGCIVLPAFKVLQIGAMSVGFEKDSLETLSMITGLCSTGYSLGAFAGTAAAGAMADYFGFTNSFSAIGIVNLLMCLVLLVYFTYKRKDLNRYVQQI